MRYRPILLSASAAGLFTILSLTPHVPKALAIPQDHQHDIQVDDVGTQQNVDVDNHHHSDTDSDQQNTDHLNDEHQHQDNHDSNQVEHSHQDEHQQHDSSSGGDEHDHGSHTAPIEFLNETQILQKHSPDPLAYWRYDLQKPENYPQHLQELGISDDAPRHPNLMVAHVVFMTLAFLIVLPVGLALRTAHHPLHVPFNILFLVLFFIGIILSSAYSALTPNLYENNTHAKFGWLSVFFIAFVFGIEFLTFFKRLIYWFKGERSLQSFISEVLSGSSTKSLDYETVPFNDDTEYLSNQDHHHHEHAGNDEGRQSPSSSSSDNHHSSHWSSLSNNNSKPNSPSSRPLRHPTLDEVANDRRMTVESVRSEDTLHDYPPHQRPTTLVRSPDEYESGHKNHYSHDDDHHASSYYKPNNTYRNASSSSQDDLGSSSSTTANEPMTRREKLEMVAKYLHTGAFRFLFLVFFIQLQSGIAVYSGSCRREYLNGCAAHMIKGGIFFLYGLLTWARFVGGWAEYGFAWNKKPHTSGWRSKVPTFEFLESSVIFAYGASNTWMERFGAAPGSPYTVKQVQHISIAVMFWAAGAVGLLLEWKKARSWLVDNVVSHANRAGTRVTTVANPSITFNPFPALCIGITGLAMSFHHQTYVFQVKIHELWGYLLAAFALFRFLTYFFLHLRPPASVLPSRPPTEALAAFFLTCGGMSFVLSTEQVTYAAMRYGYDDVMAFLNLTASVVATLFALITVVLAIKGWASQRMERANRRATEIALS